MHVRRSLATALTSVIAVGVSGLLKAVATPGPRADAGIGDDDPDGSYLDRVTLLDGSSGHRSNGNEDVVSYDNFWVKVGLTVFLVLLGGIFAGLTLGLMSLDATNLHILASSGDERQRKYAARIQPIRRNGHLLLVTLLLGNVLVNETLPIIMDDIIGGGIVAIFISSALIVVFGEIVPQSVCSRYGLAVGAFFAWPTQVMIWILFPIAYPIACLLDTILGKNHGIIYRRAELKELIHYHGASTEHGGDLGADTVTIIKGALDLQEKVVESAMTPIEKAFMISIDSVLDKSTVTKIVDSGHSRIPVLSGSRDKIEGVFLTKRLVLYNPDKPQRLTDFPINPIPIVKAKKPLFDMLNKFQDGHSHMAVVKSSHDDPTPIGIITLEDVLEELIQEEIYDETDVRVGLAVPLQTGDRLILASKRRRLTGRNQCVRAGINKFKTQRPVRSNTHPVTRRDTNAVNGNLADKSERNLIVFDEPESFEPADDSVRSGDQNLV